MTAPHLRVLLAAIVAVGLLGGVAMVSADAGADDSAVDWMHDAMSDHVPGDHHDDHVPGEHHDGDHQAHHDEHHADGGHCD